MIQVTMREWNVLTFIQSFVRKHGYVPTTAQIMAGCGIRSAAAFEDAMFALREEGLVSKRDGATMTWRVCKMPVGVAP